ncbi:uncharacterized protein LOC112684083 isoform X2 [Sipha flava]|uniref:Uncharacterized protein LOC112684083 isoform X2 n=1 Tax=Sipha flava TaxID=143950 RepID=A0A8B8FKJ9_9HEMI|nr:uncharacterized protein LOC112684083 isoform X2 [Sipha flava]
MSKLESGPEASSTAIKSTNQRSFINRLQNSNSNDTFSSIFSDELTDEDLVKRTFSELSNCKNNVKMNSMLSSFSGQSSLGILELDNMSDIGNTHKRDTFNFNHHNKSSVQQHCLSQAAQNENTLARARANSRLNIFNNTKKNDNFKTSLTNNTNAFEDFVRVHIDKSNSSFSSDDFISGNEFKENLKKIEDTNRIEFGSLSESRFNFSLEGEKQSVENGSFAAKYFAAKSVPIEDLSAIFPKRPNNNVTFTKELKEKPCSLLIPSDIKNNYKDQTPVGYKTMSSITSWTDSHVSNNILNLTSLSDISEVLTSDTNSANPKELTKALLAGDLSDDKPLNDLNYFLPRRFSTSTRFSNASPNFEHAEISLPSLENFSFDNSKTISNKKILEFNESISFNDKDDNEKHEKCINTLFQHKKNNNMSEHFVKKQRKLHLNNSYFNLTPKRGYFEDCTSEAKILENNINLSNFSILTNNYDEFTEMSLNKSANVSKIIHCNETLCQDKLNQSVIKDYREISEVLEIGDTCIGTYSQVVITLENQLNIDAKYTLNLLNISLKYNENNTFDDKKPTGTKVATVLCSEKMCTISAFTEASFTIGIIPLISGVININIKLESNDISQEIYRNIQINSIEPQIIWVNNSFGSIDFGLLPELSQKSLPIKLLNKGTCQVPIKFILNQDQIEDIFQAKAIINPSELWECDLNILTSSFSTNNHKIKLITGRLLVFLDSVEDLSTNYSPLLYCSNLLGRVCFTSISFDQNPLILQTNGHSTLNGVLEVSNNSELPISLFVQKNSKEHTDFTIQPNQFQLAINEKIKIKISYSPINSINFINETSICLQVMSSKKKFTVKINCIEPKSEFVHKSSLSSRPISPWSSSSSSAGGQLELESTCSSLIWGSVPSNSKSVQTFILRNRGAHKEKLLLNIEDNKNCFKLISSGENQVSEMKLLLEPMESQKLSVALISTLNEGQAYGHIILQRQNSSEKRVISLYGYCGHSVITINGIFEDNLGNMWIYPNPQLMSAQFSVTNSGNTTAFFKVCQENSSEDIIQPDEFLLKKGETTIINVTIVMSPERLEMLIEKDSNLKVININKLSLIYGDEVSRERISRLWKKIKHEKKIVYPVQQRLDEISNLFGGSSFIKVDHLADSVKSLSKLWKMGISENSIVVLMEKSNLESLLCDTTTVFSELETTVFGRTK